jgi:hypothetical protein
MTIDSGEVLTIIAAVVIPVFGWLLNRVMGLTRDFIELAEKYDAVKFSFKGLTDRLTKLEESIPVEIKNIEDKMLNYFNENNRNISALKDAMAELNLDLVNKVNDSQKEILAEIRRQREAS